MAQNTPSPTPQPQPTTGNPRGNPNVAPPQSTPANPGQNPNAPTSAAGTSQQPVQATLALNYNTLAEAAQALERAPQSDPAVETTVVAIRNKLDALLQINPIEAKTLQGKDTASFRHGAQQPISVRSTTDPDAQRKNVVGAMRTLGEMQSENPDYKAVHKMAADLLVAIPKIPEPPPVPQPAASTSPAQTPSTPPTTSPASSTTTQPPSTVVTTPKKESWWTHYVKNRWQKSFGWLAKKLTLFINEEKTSKFDAFSPNFFLRRK